MRKKKSKEDFLLEMLNEINEKLAGVKSKAELKIINDIYSRFLLPEPKIDIEESRDISGNSFYRFTVRSPFFLGFGLYYPYDNKLHFTELYIDNWDGFFTDISKILDKGYVVSFDQITFGGHPKSYFMLKRIAKELKCDKWINDDSGLTVECSKK